MEQILVMINDEPRVRLADDEWIAEHAISLGALDDDDPWDFIERYYDEFHVIDKPQDVDSFISNYSGKPDGFVVNEVCLIRDGWLLEEV